MLSLCRPETLKGKLRRSVGLMNSVVAFRNAKKSEAVRNFQQLTHCADSNVVWQAQAWLGYCYLHEHGVEKNIALALFWLTKALFNIPAGKMGMEEQECFQKLKKALHEEIGTKDGVDSEYRLMALTALYEYLHSKADNAEYNVLANLRRSFPGNQFFFQLCKFHGWNKEEKIASDDFVTAIINSPENKNNYLIHLLGRLTLFNGRHQADRIEVLKSLASQGFTCAYYYIAQAYFYAKPERKKEAIFWYQKAAANKADDVARLALKQIVKLLEAKTEVEDDPFVRVFSLLKLYEIGEKEEANKELLKYQQCTSDQLQFHACVGLWKIAKKDQRLSQPGNEEEIEGLFTGIKKTSMQKLQPFFSGVLKQYEKKFEEAIRFFNQVVENGFIYGYFGILDCYKLLIEHQSDFRRHNIQAYCNAINAAHAAASKSPAEPISAVLLAHIHNCFEKLQFSDDDNNRCQYEAVKVECYVREAETLPYKDDAYQKALLEKALQCYEYMRDNSDPNTDQKQTFHEVEQKAKSLLRKLNANDVDEKEVVSLGKNISSPAMTRL